MDVFPVHFLEKKNPFYFLIKIWLKFTDTGHQDIYMYDIDSNNLRAKS